jgi:hypothetical protein
VPEEGKPVTRAPWPGTAREPPPPAPLPDDLVADVIRQLAHEFGAFAVAAAVLLALLALAGCQSLTVTRGDETIKVSSTLTKLNFTTTCAQYDASGNLLSQTTQNINSTGDVDMLHEAGAIVGQALAFAAKLGAKAATGGAAPAIRGAVPSYGDARAVTACNGEHTTTIPMLEAGEP